MTWRLLSDITSISFSSQPGRDEHSNIAAKGLSGEGYEGIISGIQKCICSHFLP